MEMSKETAKEIQELATAVQIHLGHESYLTAAELLQRMISKIFYSSPSWTHQGTEPAAVRHDKYALFCGAVSPQIEQVFSNLLDRSRVGHEDEKPIRSDGFVYTEDDRPC